MEEDSQKPKDPKSFTGRIVYDYNHRQTGAPKKLIEFDDDPEPVESVPGLRIAFPEEVLNKPHNAPNTPAYNPIYDITSMSTGDHLRPPLCSQNTHKQNSSKETWRGSSFESSGSGLAYSQSRNYQDKSNFSERQRSSERTVEPSTGIGHKRQSVSQPYERHNHDYQKGSWSKHHKDRRYYPNRNTDNQWSGRQDCNQRRPTVGTERMRTSSGDSGAKFPKIVHDNRQTEVRRSGQPKATHNANTHKVPYSEYYGSKPSAADDRKHPQTSRDDKCHDLGRSMNQKDLTSDEHLRFQKLTTNSSETRNSSTARCSTETSILDPRLQSRSRRMSQNDVTPDTLLFPSLNTNINSGESVQKVRTDAVPSSSNTSKFVVPLPDRPLPLRLDLDDASTSEVADLICKIRAEHSMPWTQLGDKQSAIDETPGQKSDQLANTTARKNSAESKRPEVAKQPGDKQSATDETPGQKSDQLANTTARKNSAESKRPEVAKQPGDKQSAIDETPGQKSYQVINTTARKNSSESIRPEVRKWPGDKQSAVDEIPNQKSYQGINTPARKNSAESKRPEVRKGPGDKQSAIDETPNQKSYQGINTPARKNSAESKRPVVAKRPGDKQLVEAETTLSKKPALNVQVAAANLETLATTTKKVSVENLQQERAKPFEFKMPDIPKRKSNRLPKIQIRNCATTGKLISFQSEYSSSDITRNRSVKSLRLPSPDVVSNVPNTIKAQACSSSAGKPIQSENKYSAVVTFIGAGQESSSSSRQSASGKKNKDLKTDLSRTAVLPPNVPGTSRIIVNTTLSTTSKRCLFADIETENLVETVLVLAIKSKLELLLLEGLTLATIKLLLLYEFEDRLSTENKLEHLERILCDINEDVIRDKLEQSSYSHTSHENTIQHVSPEVMAKYVRILIQAEDCLGQEQFEVFRAVFLVVKHRCHQILVHYLKIYASTNNVEERFTWILHYLKYKDILTKEMHEDWSDDLLKKAVQVYQTAKSYLISTNTAMANLDNSYVGPDRFKRQLDMTCAVAIKRNARLASLASSQAQAKK